MKKVIRKMVALSLSFSLFVSSVAAVAVTDEMIYDSYQSEVTVAELVGSGYTLENARRLLEFDRIIKKMETYGQSVDIDENGEILFSTADNGINYLTDAEMNLAEEMICSQIEEQENALYSREEAYETLFQQMSDNPGERSYVVQISENTMLRATTIVKEEESEEPISTFSTIGPVIEDQYQFFEYGYKDIDYVLEEVSGTYFAKTQIEARVTSTEESMSLSKIDGAEAAVGIISVQNAGVNVVAYEATETGDYCQVSNNVVFSLSGSVGITLKGIISVSLTGGSTWTQKAIIRAHKTSGFGIAWTLAELFVP